MGRLLAVGIACLQVVAWPDASRGQEEAAIPCSSERVGLVACVAGKLCACRLDRGGAATGLPAGFRWDCGVLRPACGPGEPPAALDRYPYPLPPALGINALRRWRHHDGDRQSRTGAE